MAGESNTLRNAVHQNQELLGDVYINKNITVPTVLNVDFCILASACRMMHMEHEYIVKVTLTVQLKLV